MCVATVCKQWHAAVRQMHLTVPAMAGVDCGFGLCALAEPVEPLAEFTEEGDLIWNDDLVKKN